MRGEPRMHRQYSEESSNTLKVLYRYHIQSESQAKTDERVEDEDSSHCQGRACHAVTVRFSLILIVK